MLFTKAGEYALLASALIARDTKPIGVDSLSSTLGISKSFLAKILQNLAKNSILDSYKGAKGGFTLAKKPSEISIYEIIKACDETSGVVFACSDGDKCCPNTPQKEKSCIVWRLLNEVQTRVDDLLQATKLSDLLE